MSMTYDEIIMQYAETVQVYSPDGQRVLRVLDSKLDQYTLAESAERRDFWRDVQGRFLRKEFYVELERMKNLETLHRSIEQIYSIGKSNASTTRTHEWIKALPQIEEYVNRVVDYRFELDELYVSEAEERVQCTADSLRFIDSMSAVTKKDDIQTWVCYLPLMMWTLENLLIYHRYATQFNEFVEEIILPVFKYHRAYANKFVELIQSEPDINNFDASQVFNNDKFKFDPLPSLDNVSYDMFTTGWMHAIETGDYTRIDLESAAAVRKGNPLYCVYRFFYLATEIVIDEETEYISTTSIVIGVHNACELQINTFSQANIEYIILANAHSLLAIPPGSIRRTLAVWEQLEETAREATSRLLEAEILDGETAISIDRFLRQGRRQMTACQ